MAKVRGTSAAHRCLRVGVMTLGLAGGVSPLVHAGGTCGTGGARDGDVALAGYSYQVKVPAGYSEATPMPVVIAMHGDGADWQNSWGFYGEIWQGKQDFILVMPSLGNYRDDLDGRQVWLEQLVSEDLSSKYNVDVDRIYLWGSSGGAFMAAIVAMPHQDWFAAMGMVLGGNATYQAPAQESCKIPARFVLCPTDFLYGEAHGFHETLMSNGHASEFVDGDCEGHKTDYEQGLVAMHDWYLQQTRCSAMSPDGCQEIGTPAGATGGTTGTGTGTTSAAATTMGTTSAVSGQGTTADPATTGATMATGTTTASSKVSPTDEGCSCSAGASVAHAASLVLLTLLRRRRFSGGAWTRCRWP